MARKKVAEVIKVNPKDMGGRKTLPCFVEMMAFMSCIKENAFDTTPCQKHLSALDACMDTQKSKGKTRNTINFHLQRIAKSMRR
ncbi:hypothetical protein CLOM_g22785 [Closterium sp. NIES-68]|nr:hypothetical protein CLOM_g22785 [Closterium sp. NIES-68]GJP76520.1 hypothetical protein CLOP_g6952 [Closterium sp. NIES-67]